MKTKTEKFEIKFRAFVTVNGDEKEMVYNWCFLNPENNHFYGVDTTNERPDIGDVIDVMQFTGLKDKNGVEIYEGDILSFITQRKKGFQEDGREAILKPVEFGRFCYGNNVLGLFTGFHIDGGSVEYKLSHDCQVIGNIHQNPELLNLKNP